MNTPGVAIRDQERAAVKCVERSAAIRAFLLPLPLADATCAVFCLFSHHQVVEVLGRRPVQRIPLSPAYLHGVIRYADQLLPVIHLNGLCNRSMVGYPEGYRQLVVVRTGANDPVSGIPLKAAIAVNGRVQMTTLSSQVLATESAEQEAPASLRATGLLRGYVLQPSGGIAVIDLSRVVLGTFADVVPAD